MRKRKQQVSMDNLTLAKPKRSSNSGGELGHFDGIPVDLMVNILSRLPIEYIAKCRCISKLWSSIIRRPNYNLLFQIKYPVTPRLLFAFEISGNLFFYSSPQPQNLDKGSLVPTQYIHLTPGRSFDKLCGPVFGFVYRQHIGDKYTSVGVSNPITGEYVTSPKLWHDWTKRQVRFSLGYNPIDTQLKILSITWSDSLRIIIIYLSFWKEAVNDEMDSIMGNNTWVLTDLPPGCKALGSKWIFKKKKKVDGKIDKFKARLVIQGFRQREGIDYFDTYAPVVRISSIRLLIGLAAIHNIVIHQMNVKTAFLNGVLEEEVYNFVSYQKQLFL